MIYIKKSKPGFMFRITGGRSYFLNYVSENFEQLLREAGLLEKIDFTDKKLDLLDIDVEGADLKVLKGFNIEKFKPELICVEIHEKDIKNSEIYKYLSNFSYELVWSGVFSHIFKSKS